MVPQRNVRIEFGESVHQKRLQDQNLKRRKSKQKKVCVGLTSLPSGEAPLSPVSSEPAFYPHINVNIGEARRQLPFSLIHVC